MLKILMKISNRFIHFKIVLLLKLINLIFNYTDLKKEFGSIDVKNQLKNKIDI